jgi:CDGSH-type Zn-finger protein
MSAPLIPQKAPYAVQETARKVAWCQCGRSANQPYCDGSHRDTDIRPIVVELAEDRLVKWCGCKHSKNKPYCDGSHRSL